MAGAIRLVPIEASMTGSIVADPSFLQDVGGRRPLRLAVLLLVLVGCGPLSASEDSEASTALLEIERSFAATPRQQAEAALRAFIHRWPRTDAGERALLWQGDLSLQSGQLGDGDASYRAALGSSKDERSTTLAWRGLGNVALERHAWADAVDDFTRARSTAVGSLAVDLDEKRAIAVREQARYRVELLAWGILAIFIIASILQIYSAHNRALPGATVFLLPTYGVFLLMARGHDVRVCRALVAIIAGSITLTTLTLARPLPASRLSRVLLLVSVSLANLCMLYVACRRSGILDQLWETLHSGGEAG